MKKTISIVIAGQVFYIEEDAYKNLESYLNSIKSYFSKMEGSLEIIEDIEYRIAEKFISIKEKSKNEAISQDNVREVISIMGTVADFQEFETPQEADSQSHYQGSSQNDYSENNRKFRRDSSNKKIGGVIAGLANYLSFDVTILRILFLLGFLGLLPLMHIGNFIFWAYIICWIAVPAEEVNVNPMPKIKKFFRDRENKVIGGVISGISAYTGWDIAILRIAALLLLIPFGFGLWIYLIVLIVTPYAESTTDKMQMRGEPITLENIENNLKKNYEAIGGDGVISKISDAIFNVVRTISEFLITILKSIRWVIQIGFGFIFSIVGLLLIFSTFLIAFSGFSNWENIDSIVHLGSDFSANLLISEFPSWMIWIILAVFVPISLSFLIGGISLLINKKLANKTYSLVSMFVFFAGIAGLFFFGSRYAGNFKERSSFNEFNEYAINDKVPVFNMESQVHIKTKGNLVEKLSLFNYSEDNDEFQYSDEIFSPSIRLEGYRGDKIQILEYASARGKTYQDADKASESINYVVNIQDSLYNFPRKFDIGIKSFRAQNLKVKIMIPEGAFFKINKPFGYKIENVVHGLSRLDLSKALFTVNEKGKIECVNYPQNNRNEGFEDEDFHNDMDFDSEMND